MTDDSVRRVRPAVPPSTAGAEPVPVAVDRWASILGEAIGKLEQVMAEVKEAGKHDSTESGG